MITLEDACCGLICFPFFWILSCYAVALVLFHVNSFNFFLLQKFSGLIVSSLTREVLRYWIKWCNKIVLAALGSLAVSGDLYLPRPLE